MPGRVRRDLPVNLIVALAAGLWAGAVFWSTERWSWDVGGAFFVVPVLTAISVPLLLRLGRRDPDPRMAGLLVLAFFAKLAGTLARYLVLTVLYGGVGDSVLYDQGARSSYRDVRQGHLFADPGIGRDAVTTHVAQATAWVYAIIGPSLLGGFFVFSFLSFWATILCVRAVRLAVPQADAYRYALLLLFLPSVVFWPSSIGKEALAVTGIGVCVYGMARLFAARHGGYPLLGAGLVLLVLVRPHVAALLVVGFLAALMLGRNVSQRAGRSVGTVLALTVTAVAAYFIATKAAASLGVQHLDVTGLENALAEASTRTSEGGSAFTPATVHTPLDLPWATLTVLFRPLPFEAHNLLSLISSAEGTFLLGFTLYLVLKPGWRHHLRQAARNRLVVMSLVYTLAFVIAFSSFGNFGILARQRTQVQPLLLIALALPASLPTRRTPRLAPARARRTERIPA